MGHGDAAGEAAECGEDEGVVGAMVGSVIAAVIRTVGSIDDEGGNGDAAAVEIGQANAGVNVAAEGGRFGFVSGVVNEGDAGLGVLVRGLQVEFDRPIARAGVVVADDQNNVDVGVLISPGDHRIKENFVHARLGVEEVAQNDEAIRAGRGEEQRESIEVVARGAGGYGQAELAKSSRLAEVKISDDQCRAVFPEQSAIGQGAKRLAGEVNANDASVGAFASSEMLNRNGVFGLVICCID